MRREGDFGRGMSSLNGQVFEERLEMSRLFGGRLLLALCLCDVA